MDRSPSTTAARPKPDRRHLGVASRRLWASIWAALAVVLVVAVADYLTMFLSAVVPLWLWCITGGGLVLATAFVAVVVDVASVRRARGRRRPDVVAHVAAAVLVGLWVWLLWRLLTGGCLAEECQSASLSTSLFVLFPVVPVAGLTLIGFLVRRGHHAQD